MKKCKLCQSQVQLFVNNGPSHFVEQLTGRKLWDGVEETIMTPVFGVSEFNTGLCYFHNKVEQGLFDPKKTKTINLKDLQREFDEGRM